MNSISFECCEFCGKKKNIIGTVNGVFCEDCLLTFIIEFQRAHGILEEYNENTVINKLKEVKQCEM